MTRQPTYDEKVQALTDYASSSWGYRFAVPAVTAARWSVDDWIRHIGDNWYPKSAKEQP